MSPSDGTFAELRSSGLPGQLCLTWCRGDDLEEVARRFGADLPSGVWADPDDLEDLEESYHGQLLQLTSLDGWVLALEPSGFQGVRPEVLGPLSSSGRAALSVFWNVELDSSICYAADGQIMTSFKLIDVESRTGAAPTALDAVLDEFGLHTELPIDECKARSLTLGEKVSGRPIPTGWLDSPQLVYTITDPLPDLPVPPFGPQPSFLSEPQFAHILTGPPPVAALAIARMVASLAAGVATLRDGLTEEIMTLLDHGERRPGQRETLRAELTAHADATWQEARRLRSAAPLGRADGALEFEVAAHAARVLMATLLPDPVAAASAATSQGHHLRLPADGHARMQVLYKTMQRIEYDLRHP
ncbi:DUF6461 domain-containing protein [Nonomuraea bangladeshensis]|uniref:DUF6461 domain-containing protein n=1 Tax=Nonomuraea bangladeshensis TaxID=404385 RepID=A0ABV3HA09_9ACTN